jgi:CarD family transcriptional regulator
MTFQVGEKVIYPNHGVGTIENISTRSFGAGLEQFYLLRLSYNGTTVMVPFSHASAVGLRKVTKAGEITRVLEFLATGTCKSIPDWKVRFKVNSEKMRSGSLLEIAEVFKALLTIQAEKPLSFREKKMLDRARQMLISEVSICRAVQERLAVELLQKSLSKSALNLPEPL